MKRPLTFAIVVAAALASVGCGKLFDKSGTCEFTFEQQSSDGSIPAGLEVCIGKWPEDQCGLGPLNPVTLGLKTSGYTFTKGGACEEMGYQRCDNMVGNMFYKTCPVNEAKKAAEAAPPGRRGSAKRAGGSAKIKTEIDAPLSLPTDAPFLGNGEGSKVVQVVLDVQDPFGKRVMPTLKEIVAAQPDLKVVVRHWPLPFHREALLAHQAALEAMSQKGNEGFWSLYDLMLDNQRRLKQDDLVRYAGEIELDVSAFEAALTSKKHEARIKKDMDEMKAAGITGVPAFVADKRLLSGAQPRARLEAFLTP